MGSHGRRWVVTVTGGQGGSVSPSSWKVIGLSFLEDVSPRGVVASWAPDPMPSAPRPLNWGPGVRFRRSGAPQPRRVFAGAPLPLPASAFPFLAAARRQTGCTWEVACSSVSHPAPSGRTQVSVDFYLGDQSPSRAAFPQSCLAASLGTSWNGSGLAAPAERWPIRVNDPIADIAAGSGVGRTPL